jgi:trehalose-6-phosphate synthase
MAEIHWTKEKLNDLIKEKLKNHKLIVVANREPYIHRQVGSRIECIRPASGMAAAIDPILRACGGVWIAHGSGDADRKTVDEHDHLRVPPDEPLYTLRRVWLTKEQEQGYYYGLANEGLWPLCHTVFTRPVFLPQHWETYRQVNELFGRAVLEEAGSDRTFVFIQDYHFGLLPRILKRENPGLCVAQFWHIPWPNAEAFRVFPWKEELVDGLLGNDLIGFHLQYHCLNFLETIHRTVEARVDLENSDIIHGGEGTRVRPFPISIDFERHSRIAASAAIEEQVSRWRQEIGINDEWVGVGIDRIDYTKGIPDRLRMIDRFLEKNPAYVGRLIFIQAGVPSRVRIRPYKILDDELESLVEELNWKWSTPAWRPIVYLRQNCSPSEMMALHRLAHFVMVTSLHDGMNLLAKEFVGSRTDEDGVLILSQFAGAACELEDALLVNPFSVDEGADAVLHALEMSAEERRRRMQRLRAVVAGNNIYRWAGDIISNLLRFDSVRRPKKALARRAVARPAVRR